MANKYCYAVVHKDSGKLLLEDHKLPIYWNRKVAKETTERFSNYRVEPVLLKELHKFILTFPY